MKPVQINLFSLEWLFIFGKEMQNFFSTFSNRLNPKQHCKIQSKKMLLSILFINFWKTGKKNRTVYTHNSLYYVNKNIIWHMLSTKYWIFNTNLQRRNNQ